MKGIKNTTIAEIAFVGVSALFIMTFLLINFMGFEQTATSDVYADTLFAMEAWDSKSISPMAGCSEINTMLSLLPFFAP